MSLAAYADFSQKSENTPDYATGRITFGSLFFQLVFYRFSAETRSRFFKTLFFFLSFGIQTNSQSRDL